VAHRASLLFAALLASAIVAGGGSPASASAQLTRERLAEEADFTRNASGWSSEECEITRIFVSRHEVRAAEAAERRRDSADGSEGGGLVVIAATSRFGVELGHNFFYCQEAIEDALVWVGKGGRPEGTPTTVANARVAIEALDDPVALEEPPGYPGVLVGRVQGSLGERFAFFLFVNRSAPPRMEGVPGYPGFGEGRSKGGLLGGGLVDGYVFGSRELPRRGETKAQFKEQSKIESDVEEALCMQATGEGCGI
jgi:hypothetical protein